MPVVENKPCYTTHTFGFLPITTDTYLSFRASYFWTMAPPRLVDSLRKEIGNLQRELGAARAELEEFKLRLKMVEAAPWERKTPESPRNITVEEMVAEVVGGGKRRRVGEVGREVDPEKAQPVGVIMGLKVGCVLWEDGIGGVEKGLEAVRIEICDEGRWLVGESTRRERMEAGKKSSTVLVKVRGEEVANRLFRTGLWVGGRWCSVRRFVAIPPKRKEGWRGEVRDLRVRLDGLCRAGERSEDKMVKKMEEMMGMWRKEGGEKGKEVPARKKGERYWMSNDGEKPDWLRREGKEKAREGERKGEKKKETKLEWEERMVREEKEEYRRLRERDSMLSERDLEDILRREMEGASDRGGDNSMWDSEEE